VQIKAGASAWIQRRNLEFQGDRVYRITGVSYSLVCNGSALLQVRAYGPISSKSAIAESGPIAVGVTPVRGYLRSPSAWFPLESSTDTVLIAVDHLCLGRSNLTTCLVSLKIDILISREEIPAACPKTMQSGTPEDLQAAIEKGRANLA